MSISAVVIIGEVFLVLVGVAAFLFHYLNNLNNELQSSNDQLKERLKDEQRHGKGLQVKIQQQQKLIGKLEQELKASRPADDELEKRFKELEGEYQYALQQLEAMEKDNKSLKRQISQVNEQLASRKETIESQGSKAASIEGKDDFEQLYYDLKNSIAYSMSGGSDILDSLRDRLRENGNLQESEELDDLKERYNTLNEMLGMSSGAELFSEEDDADADAEELKSISNAESILSGIDITMKDAEAMSRRSATMLANSQETAANLAAQLNNAMSMNTRLRSDLDNTTRQLMAFVKKAQVFQAQKDQLKMHKAAQNKMHRDYVKLNNEFKQLNRKYRTLESRNDVLSVQIKNSALDSELVKKLEKVRAELEQKEQLMDRMLIEKDMLEQQFLTMSEEFGSSEDSKEALERLQSEHKLLEQQFMEVLKELDESGTGSSDVLAEQPDETSETLQAASAQDQDLHKEAEQPEKAG